MSVFDNLLCRGCKEGGFKNGFRIESTVKSVKMEHVKGQKKKTEEQISVINVRFDITSVCMFIQTDTHMHTLTFFLLIPIPKGVITVYFQKLQ